MGAPCTTMESIFHEKQEGSLCAQHCLNSLLQGSYFTAVDLSVLAHKLDEEERLHMAECGEESEEYKKFLNQPSVNMDDSGYFSIQVISKALQVWGLELVPYASNDARLKDKEPDSMEAFICNYQNHWFTIRKLGSQWFNLNSLLNRPVLISDTYLALFLAQLKNEGYSIFVVFGALPECVADEVLRQTPMTELEKALELSLSDDFEGAVNEEEELQKALILSLAHENDEESNLKKAILMSLENV